MTNSNPQSSPSSDLQEAIKKCFKDTYMETEGDTELFDIDETVAALEALIQKRERAAVVEALAELLGEIDTMPHYIRSKFAEHVETTAEDDAEMLLADEVKIIIAATLSNNEGE